MSDFPKLVIATVSSAITAGIAFLLIAVGSMPAGLAAAKLGLISDEGAAWIGISVGIPLGLVGGGIVFFLF